jgi:5-methylcytosine-specific restriction endonuclease McrA
MPRRIYDWAEIQRFHDEGHGFVECQKRFGVTHTAWRKAILRGELLTEPREFRERRRRYDWSAVQAYYDEGHTYRECRAYFGFSAGSWTKAVNRRELRARARAWPLAIMLIKTKARSVVRRRLLLDGIFENRCTICNIEDWLGKPLAMHIDHINGVRDDHRLENLRMLCPNCHSQTDTYGGRNVKRSRSLQERRKVV